MNSSAADGQKTRPDSAPQTGIDCRVQWIDERDVEFPDEPLPPRFLRDQRLHRIALAIRHCCRHTRLIQWERIL